MQSLVNDIIKQVEDAARVACQSYIGHTGDSLDTIMTAVKNQVDNFFADDETIIIDKNEIQFKYGKDKNIVPANLYTALLMQGIFVSPKMIKNGRHRTLNGTEYYLDENDALVMCPKYPLKFIKVNVVVKKEI